MNKLSTVPPEVRPHAASSCETLERVAPASPLAQHVSAPETLPTPLHQFLGRHMLVEFYGCNPNVLNNPEKIESLMCQAAVNCGATIVQQNFHHFSPFGVSGVVVIAESHLAIHTWPEYGYAAVDLYTCGEQCDPGIAFDYLQNHMAAKQSHVTELRRGLLDTQRNVMVKTPFQITQSMHQHHQHTEGGN